MSAPAFCTILARNYLPKALALAESVRRHHGERPLVVFVVDATADTELPAIEGVRWMHPGELDVPERTVLDLAAFYDLVEFATALKPLVLQRLLQEFEQVAYLDPDTYVTSPMTELGPALDDGSGIVLTPHYLRPTPPDHDFAEGHLLCVGVYNLGFCAVDRRAGDFLAWWWAHLRTECLHDPIAGLFVDQKWVDIGSVLFHATSLQHPGYNVGVTNLHERPVVTDDGGYRIGGTDDRLRLFHFHAFDPQRPDELCVRTDLDTSRLLADNESLRALCREYGARVLANQELLGLQPDYRYWTDTTGRRITRRMRHAYRAATLAAPGSVPSPFVASEARDYERWRRGAWRLAGKLMFSDVAKGVRCALPDEYASLKGRLPGLTRAVRRRYVDSSGMWR